LENTRDLLLKKLSFGYGNEALKLIEKLCRRALKNTCKKSYPKLAKTTQYIGCQKLAVGGQNDLSVDRPVD